LEEENIEIEGLYHNHRCAIEIKHRKWRFAINQFDISVIIVGLERIGILRNRGWVRKMQQNFGINHAIIKLEFN
jgi:hypothetical protein